MLVVMNANATEAEIAGVVRVIESLGLRAHTMPGATRTAIGITGNKGAISLQHFENLPGVAEAIRVSKPYKLITLDLKQDRTIVDIGGARIGNGSLAMIAGPCAIETHQQAFAIAEIVKKRRHDSDRLAQHAKLHSVAAGRTFEAAGTAQARDGRHAGGMVARGRIHYVGRQLPSCSLRTRCPHLRPTHSQHPRSRRRAGSATYLAFTH